LSHFASARPSTRPTIFYKRLLSERTPNVMICATCHTFRGRKSMIFCRPCLADIDIDIGISLRLGSLTAHKQVVLDRVDVAEPER